MAVENQERKGLYEEKAARRKELAGMSNAIVCCVNDNSLRKIIFTARKIDQQLGRFKNDLFQPGFNPAIIAEVSKSLNEIGINLDEIQTKVSGSYDLNKRQNEKGKDKEKEKK